MVGGEGNGLGTELSFGLTTDSTSNCLTLKFGIFEGVTSNTDAAQLAEIFAAAKCPTKVNNACDFIIYCIVS